MKFAASGSPRSSSGIVWKRARSGAAASSSRATACSNNALSTPGPERPQTRAAARDDVLQVPVVTGLLGRGRPGS